MLTVKNADIVAVEDTSSYGKFSLSLKEPYIFSKFNPSNMDTRLCGQRTIVSCPANRFSFLTEGQHR